MDAYQHLPPLPDDMDPMAGLPPVQMPGPVPSVPFAGMPDPSQQFGGSPLPANGIPRFFLKPVRCTGGAWENVEMVEVMTPGDKFASPVHKVTDRLREKYRPWYEQWKRGLQTTSMGTPLEAYPRLTPAVIQHLKAINVYNVEQLAAMADANLHHIPLGDTLRKEARDWLAAKESSDAIEKRAAENQMLKDAMTLLEEQNMALRKQMEDQAGSFQAQMNAVLQRIGAPAGGESQAPSEDSDDAPLAAITSPAELLAAMPTMRFMTFRAEARRFLGDACPEKKEEIVAALKAAG